VKAIFIKNSWIFLWICGLVLALRCTNFYKIPTFNLVVMSQNVFFSQNGQLKNFLLLSFFGWNFFHWFSSKFLNIYLANPNSRTYTFYVIKCQKVKIILHSIQFAPILCCFAFSFGFIFIQMYHIASNVLTVRIEKTWFFTIFFNFHKLTFLLCFLSTPISLGLFSTKLHMYSSSNNWYM
jgi:hypothetical protein